MSLWKLSVRILNRALITDSQNRQTQAERDVECSVGSLLVMWEKVSHRVKLEEPNP